MDNPARHSMTKERSAQIGALYIHIPFCERKCEYCDFVSVAGARGQHQYVGALVSELRALGAALKGSPLDTVFCGGGTPGLLDLRLLATVMEEVRTNFVISPGAELTLEVNPSSSSAQRARAWRDAEGTWHLGRGLDGAPTPGDRVAEGLLVPVAQIRCGTRDPLEPGERLGVTRAVPFRHRPQHRRPHQRRVRPPRLGCGLKKRILRRGERVTDGIHAARV